MEIRLAGEVLFDSIVDGTGLRAIIFTQGCRHRCEGCHNPQTWNFNTGILINTEDVVKDIISNPLDTGVTFSGGDPLEQPLACLDIVLRLKGYGYDDFWAYTGYTWEEIQNDEDKMRFVRHLDVLVDGRFDIGKKSYSHNFRGSSNQRLIDVQKSLLNNYIVSIKEKEEARL